MMSRPKFATLGVSRVLFLALFGAATAIVLLVQLVVWHAAFAQQETSADSRDKIFRVASNADLARFMAEKLPWMQKLEPVRVAVTHGPAQDMNLSSWPGSLISKTVTETAAKCGLQMHFVSMHDDFRMLIAFYDDDGGPRVLTEAAIQAGLEVEFRRLVGDRAEIRTQIIDNFDPEYPRDYIITRARFFGIHPNLQRLSPMEFSRAHIGNFRHHIRLLVAAANDRSAYDKVEAVFIEKFLGDIVPFCPIKLWQKLLLDERLEASAELISAVLYDSRVKAGMARAEFEPLALHILNEIRR